MSGQGGWRPGAGRKKGSPNRKTIAIANAIMAGEATSPLEYMISVMRDETADPARRLEAAKSAAPYVHPRLNAVTVVGDKDNPLVVDVKSDADAFTRRIASAAARIATSGANGHSV